MAEAGERRMQSAACQAVIIALSQQGPPALSLSDSFSCPLRLMPTVPVWLLSSRLQPSSFISPCFSNWISPPPSPPARPQITLHYSDWRTLLRRVLKRGAWLTHVTAWLKASCLLFFPWICRRCSESIPSNETLCLVNLGPVVEKQILSIKYAINVLTAPGMENMFKGLMNSVDQAAPV